MKTRKLRRNGPEVSAIGLGCMGMSEFYGSRDESTAERMMLELAELGKAQLTPLSGRLRAKGRQDALPAPQGIEPTRWDGPSRQDR